MNEQQMAALQAELATADWNGLTATDAYTRMHATSETVSISRAKAYTLAELLGLVGQPSLAKLADWPQLDDLRDKIKEQDSLGVVMWGQVLLAAGKIEQIEYQAISARVQETESVDVTREKTPLVHSRFVGIASFPHVIPQDQFNAAWVAAGRTL